MQHARLPFRTALFLAAALSSAVCKLVLIPRAQWTLGLASYAVETCVLGCVWLASERIDGPTRARRGLAIVTFYPLFYLLFALHLAHTFFFDQATTRRFSLLDVGLSSIGYFFAHVIPLHGLLAFGVVLVALHGAAYWLTRWSWPGLRRALSFSLVPLMLLVAVLLAGATPVSTPVVDIAADLREVLTHESIRWNDPKTPALPLALLDKSAGQARKLDTPFDKVIVLVMETMWADKVDRELRALSPDTFLRSASAHAHSFDRYYTTNQDSRTSVLSLLGSRFIPHEAYTEEGRDHYLFLSKERSLVDVFHELGYRTAWAASQSELELVVEDLPWDEKLMLSPEEVSAASKTSLCFNPYEFEHSCEDAVLLPKLLRFLDTHERAVVVQQMMWGHASEYNEASGKTNTRYYSEYLDRIVAHLREQGTLERTLIVVTSDHGFRGKAEQVDPAMYRVPLLFWSPRFTPERHDELLCHLELEELLLRELALERGPIHEDPFVLIVGTTGSSFVTGITRSDFVLMKDRPFASYVLSTSKLGPAHASAPSPAAYLKLYHAYRDRFGPTH